jgi:hypothetical protein
MSESPQVVILDESTAQWLKEIADLLHTSPSQVAASILRDVACDDMDAHLGEYQENRKRLH